MDSNAKSHVFKAYMSIIYSKSCTYVGFLKGTRIYIKKAHFQGISRHFQTLVSSENFQLTKISFQWYRDKVKWSYKIHYMGPPSQVFFLVTFSDFHEVSSWKCRHATESWESGHKKISVILSYNTQQNQMNFGIEGLHMCIIEHYHLQAKLLKVFQKYK